MPIGTARENGVARVRRAGLLVTAASLVVAVVTMIVAGLVVPTPARTTTLVVLVLAAFALAIWRSLRARRDRTPTVGVRSLTSWLAVFSWAATLFSALVAIASPAVGLRPVVAGVLAGCLLVLVGRIVEHQTPEK